MKNLATSLEQIYLVTDIYFWIQKSQHKQGGYLAVYKVNDTVIDVVAHRTPKKAWRLMTRIHPTMTRLCSKAA